MTPDELIQLMRTCSMAQVRAELERMIQYSGSDFEAIYKFYKRASKRKPS